MKSDATRQSDYRARLKRDGKVRLHCWVAPETRTAINEIAYQHNESVGAVIELGMHLARERLGAPKKLAVVVTRPRTPASAPPARQEPPAQAEPLSFLNNAPAGQQQPLERAAGDDTDARILAASVAYRVEP
ncbi:MAG TPA: hypothetical protein VLC92_09650 [Rhodocyclaceae bacterium]|nr:hypothetical protein [Rhodocyclaceae bacterium]